MAEKKTSSKKTSTVKKPSNTESERRAKAALAKSQARSRIWSVILFVLGLFVFCVAVIPGDEGWKALHEFFLGIFGISAFLVGPIMIYAAVMISANKSRTKLKWRILQLSFTLLILSGAMQIFFVGQVGGENMGFVDTIAALYSDGVKLIGGGVLSAALAAPLLLFSRLGASIIIILIAFTFIMLISNITLVDFLNFCGKPFKKAAGYTKEKHRQLKEEARYVDEMYAKEDANKENDDPEFYEDNRAIQEIKQEIEEGNKSRKKITEIMRTVSTVPSAPSTQSVPENQRDTLAAPEKVILEKEASEIAEEKAEEPRDEAIQEQSEDSEEFLNEIRNYISNKNAPPKPADDKNAVEVAIEDFELEHVNESMPITEIVEEKPQSADDLKDVPHEQQTLDNAAHYQNIIQTANEYMLPPVDLLNPVVESAAQEDIDNEIQKNSDTLVETLKNFGVQTKIVGVCRGPSVTRYELQPAAGVKISRITSLADDIMLNLASAGVRIEAPIPNKAAVGIEVPNRKKDTVYFRELVDTEDFRNNSNKKLEAVLGKDIGGNTITCNVAKMPHLLIAGTTGSGKSVCVNSIIMSILLKSTPDEVRFLMIDPKKVEFMMYNGIPHLLIPVVTDPKKAAGALAWAVTEMLNRYKLFSENNVRDFGGFNELASQSDNDLEKMAQIVIFIDELADLMMASPKEVEDSICRLAQMARAAGMHLVIATQRPTVNVVTGLIKANIPSRIALMVASQVDSRTIIDSAGAEKLLGNGDMLFMPVGMPKPVRVQGCWVTDKEVERIVDFIKNSFTLDYDQDVMEEIEKQAEMVSNGNNKDDASGGDIDVSDDKLDEAIDLVISEGRASTSFLQTKLKLGYGRAARLMDIMEKMGVVGTFEGSKPRQVIMTKQEWYERKLNQQ